MSEGAAGTAASPARGWKKGLPQAGLESADEWARILWDVARHSTTSLDGFAKALGLKSPKGGGWDARIALLRGYKLIELDGDQVKLSVLGRRLINESDVEQQIDARREAMQTLRAYKDLVETYVGTPAPEKTKLATRLQYDYGKTPAVAEVAAQAFLDSLEYAKMLTSGGLITVDGSDPDAQDGTPDDEDDRAAEELDAALEELESEGRVDDRDQLDDDDENVEHGNVPVIRSGASAVTLNLSLDLSSFRAEDVLEILRELGLARRR